MLGVMMACLQARWGVSEDAAPYARLAGDELKVRLHRIMDHCSSTFRLHLVDQEGPALDTEDARLRLARLVCAVGDEGAGLEIEDDDLRHFALFVGRCESFLDELARHHLYPPTRFLGAE
jgi:hypothetical protein